MAPSRIPPASPALGKPLRRVFFARSVHEVAPALIGATLLVDGVGGIIVEVEAYHHTDPASNGSTGFREQYRQRCWSRLRRDFIWRSATP